MLKSSYDYAWHLVEEGLIPGCSNPGELIHEIKKLVIDKSVKSKVEENKFGAPIPSGPPKQ